MTVATKRIICLALSIAGAHLPNARAALQPSRPALPNIDARPRTMVQLPAAERSQAAAKLRERVPQAQIDFDEITGSPKRIAATRGFLTGLNGVGGAVSEENARSFRADDPHRATKAFLHEHKLLFGHGPEILEFARVQREHTPQHNGLRTVIWEQQLDGIAVFEAVLMSHTTRGGELVSISSQFVPDAASAANKGQRDKARRRAEPKLPGADAILKAAQNVGEPLQPADVQAQGQAGGAERKQKFKAKNLNGDTGVKLVWLPMSATEMRLCWEVILTSSSRGEMFRVLIAADTGEALVRHCLTDYISDVTYRVFTGDSPSPFSPAHSSPTTLQPPTVPRQAITLSSLNTNASPNGWINDGNNETLGNNVDAHSDRDHDDEPDLPRPQGVPFRVFDFPLDLTQQPTNYTKAAIVQLFYWCNWMHDRLYELGFTEAAGNFQVDNFGRGGEGNDPVNAQAQDGGFFSNANFATPPDGQPARMQMFIWTEPYPDRDGDLDAEVILHEYTHGLSNRRVGGGLGISAVASRGMGEGWSDFYALALLSQSSDDVDATYPVAGYSSYLLGHAENYYYGIRRYPYCTDTNRNPLTLKDIDPTQISSHPGVPRNPRGAFNTNQASEVHARGEVWCNTLWEVRANLIRKHGYATGNQLTLHLVTDAMTLCPPNPNFLQARDAIIQADFVNTGGANFREIWAGFAKRGMGSSAVCPPSTVTTGVREAFDFPDDLWATPRTEWIAKGRTGGPFEPGTRSFLLKNVGAGTINWSAFASVGWLTLSNTSGALTAGSAPAVVEASINTMANLLTAGTHVGEIVFTDQSSGRSQANAVTLTIGQLDFLTEEFDLRDNDLDYQSITFTPDGSPTFYSVCRAAATNFPVDPTGGIQFATNALSERARRVTLSPGHSVALFGMRTNSFLAVSDGSIAFFEESGTASGNLGRHFEGPRISCLKDNYANENSGRSWKELNDRVVVTFENIVSLLTTTPDRNSFQMELFYDGRIRFTYLKLDIRTGIVGLSRGMGVPPGFVESDFSAYPICLAPLTVRAPRNVTESTGTVTASVSRPFPDVSPLLVNLGVSDPPEISVPAEVVIPAGETNASFQITIIDNRDPDGPQAPILTASAPGFASGHTTIFISDDEIGSLALHLPASATEGEIVQGMVALPAPASKNVFVMLRSTDTSEALPPGLIIIPAGQTSAVFNVTIVDDTLIDGPQSAAIVAQVTNWPAASANILVQDNDNLLLSLKLALPSRAGEASGTINNGGVVSIPGKLSSNLVVSLESSDVSELQVPSTVTILAGQTSALFNPIAVNDAIVDGAQTVVVTARASGWISATATITIHDDETPLEPFAPSPANLASNQPVNLTLSWNSALGNVIANGDFELGTFAGWTRDFSAPEIDSSGVRFVINDGTYDPNEDHYDAPGPSPPYAGLFSALMSVDYCNLGWGRMFQDIYLSPNASSATLSWVDRIVNLAAYSPTQYFTVEVRDTNDVLREVLFTTSLSFPWTNNWTTRSYSLSRYLGETIRLVWKQEYYCSPIITHLDNIALQVTAVTPTSFDVYLGTNANPGASEFRGNTPKPNWNATNLQLDTVYFWRIVAKQGASQAAGPLWQFRTRPLIDHFQWSAIATQQYVGQPITVMLSAKGAANETLSNFTSPVTLSGTALTGNRQLFMDNFEDGNSEGWKVERGFAGPYNQQVTTSSAAAGQYSFTLVGGNQKHVDGYSYAFPRFSMRPDQINFSVRNSAANKAGGCFAVGNDGLGLGVGVRFYMGPSGRMGLFDRNEGFQGTNYVANRWYRVSLVFDWTRRRVNCFVDGQQIASNVPFRSPYLNDVASLHLYNFDNTQAWWDEIEIIDGSRTIPIVVSPRTASDFAHGVWFSNVSVNEPAANIWLTATTTSGHSGVSSNFTVDPNTDLDGDGLPDAWEVRYFASTNSVPGADPDADGLTNLQEFRAGTNPNSASSTLRISALVSSNGILRMRFESVAGKAYQLEHAAAPNTVPWEPIGSPLLGGGQAIQVTGPIEVTNHFYRVRVIQ